MLRHSFAVITLERFQRGQIEALAELSAEQRGHYTRVFGDPLDWVRRRLGHRSAQTTLVYLHALEELEMETRLALVPETGKTPAPLHPTPTRKRPQVSTSTDPARRGSGEPAREHRARPPAALPASTYTPPPVVQVDEAQLLAVSFHGEDGRQKLFRLNELSLPGWHTALAGALAARIGPGGSARTLASARV